MEDTAVKVHGSIFFLLKKFVENNFPPGTWGKLNTETGTSVTFEITKSYPIATIGAIIGTASKLTGISVNDLKEQFGEYLVPDLFQLYSSYLKPEWKTFDVVENTELVMHGAVRKLNSTANPPILNVVRVNEKLLMIDYHSKRRMGSLAVGIIKGIAKYYNESEKITIQNMGDPDDERVQIKVSLI